MSAPTPPGALDLEEIREALATSTTNAVLVGFPPDAIRSLLARVEALEAQNVQLCDVARRRKDEAEGNGLERDRWEADARLRAENADHWKARAEALEGELAEAREKVAEWHRETAAFNAGWEAAKRGESRDSGPDETVEHDHWLQGWEVFDHPRLLKEVERWKREYDHSIESSGIFMARAEAAEARVEALEGERDRWLDEARRILRTCYGDGIADCARDPIDLAPVRQHVLDLRATEEEWKARAERAEAVARDAIEVARAAFAHPVALARLRARLAGDTEGE